MEAHLFNFFLLPLLSVFIFPNFLFLQLRKCRIINQPSELPKPLCPLCSPHFVVSHFCRKIARAQNQNCQADCYLFCLVVLGGAEHLCASFMLTGEHWSRAVDFSGRLLSIFLTIKKLEMKITHENTVLHTGVSLS